MNQEQKIDAIMMQLRKLDVINANTDMLKDNDSKIWQQLESAIFRISKIQDLVIELYKQNQELKSQLSAIKRKLE